ncbi:hypothetical protein ACYRFT_12960 [Listeria kieliensis]
MDCYVWELDAILEGLALKQLDEKENQAVFSFNLRYILNAKKPKLKKVIDKKKQENKIKKLFNRKEKQQDENNFSKSRADAILKANEYFANKYKS